MDEIKPTIKTLADKASAAPSSHEAMQYAQVALNLANAVATLNHADNLAKP